MAKKVEKEKTKVRSPKAKRKEEEPKKRTKTVSRSKEASPTKTTKKREVRKSSPKRDVVKTKTKTVSRSPKKLDAFDARVERDLQNPDIFDVKEEESKPATLKAAEKALSKHAKKSRSPITPALAKQFPDRVAGEGGDPRYIYRLSSDKTSYDVFDRETGKTHRNQTKGVTNITGGKDSTEPEAKSPTSTGIPLGDPAKLGTSDVLEDLPESGEKEWWEEEGAFTAEELDRANPEKAGAPEEEDFHTRGGGLGEAFAPGQLERELDALEEEEGEEGEGQELSSLEEEPTLEEGERGEDREEEVLAQAPSSLSPSEQEMVREAVQKRLAESGPSAANRARYRERVRQQVREKAGRELVDAPSYLVEQEEDRLRGKGLKPYLDAHSTLVEREGGRALEKGFEPFLDAHSTLVDREVLRGDEDYEPRRRKRVNYDPDAPDTTPEQGGVIGRDKVRLQAEDDANIEYLQREADEVGRQAERDWQKREGLSPEMTEALEPTTTDEGWGEEEARKHELEMLSDEIDDRQDAEVQQFRSDLEDKGSDQIMQSSPGSAQFNRALRMIEAGSSDRQKISTLLAVAQTLNPTLTSRVKQLERRLAQRG